MKCRKITLSIPSGVVEDLDYIAGRMSITRSALLSSLLVEPVADLRVMVETIPENPTEEDIIRAKGASIPMIEDRITKARGMANDLFSE